MRYAGLVLIVLLAVALTACGLKQRTGKTVTVQGSSLRIVADEYLFDPTTIHVKPGRLRIAFHNDGTLIHNLVLSRDGQRVAKATSLEPQKTDVVDVDLRPGKYHLVCTVGDHEELGMRGEVVVQ